MFNAVVVTPVLFLALYDFTAFQPHAAAIASIIAHADPEDADPPPLVREMLLAAHSGKSGLAVPVARNLLKDRGHVRMSEWHMTFFLWSHLVCLHYSEAEIAAVFAARAYVGAGRFGLNAAALARFENPLSLLSAEEAAEIIAITWSPPLMLANPAARDRRKAIILLRYAERRAIAPAQ
jgi:membrane carboxypeptidase/penicillin-binding protein